MLSADKQPVGLIAELLDASPAVLVRTYTNFGQADVDNLFFDEQSKSEVETEMEGSAATTNRKSRTLRRL